VIDRLRGDRQVRYAEPDYVLEADGVPPNDPDFDLQWALQNTGQSVAGTSGTAGADEDVLPAWNVTTGSASIVVAVTDTGVDYDHPDLAANMWSDTLGIDGCAAGTHGFDVLAGESACDPMDTDSEYGGHGTHVAGIIGAVGNNGVGVTGVNWTSSIMAVKWLDSESAGSTSDLLNALQMVVTAKQAGVNVRVVNDSSTFPGTASSTALESEINTLGANNILFVTAAGNSGENDDDDMTPRYPCSYDLANEICVAASDQNDELPSWANYGPSSVDLAAPGNNIYSTLCSSCAGQGGASYGFISGASMSAAEVSGAAALILSAENMSVTQLKADILDNVNPIPALSGVVRTGGILDVCKAMPGCTTNPSTTPPTKSTPLPMISGTAQVGQTLSTSNGTWGGSPATYTYNWQRCDPSNNCNPTGVVSQTYLVSSADVGDTLEVAVTATNTAGFATETSAATATVSSTPPPSTGTFGKTTVGASSDTAVANRKRVNRYSVSASVSVTKLTIYLQQGGSSGTQVLEGVIYADSGGSPGALIAVSNQVTFASTSAAGWYDLPFSTPVSLAPGNYWIGFMSGSTSYVIGFRYDSVTGARLYNANTYTSGPSNPFGSASTDNEQISLYATYTTG
jgi:subtilisin family serine protease